MTKAQKILELKWELAEKQQAFYKASGAYTGAMQIYDLINYQNKTLFHKAETIMSHLWEDYERTLNAMVKVQEELEIAWKEQDGK